MSQKSFSKLERKYSLQQEQLQRKISYVPKIYKQFINTELKEEHVLMNNEEYLGVYRIKIKSISLKNTHEENYYFLNLSLGQQTYKQQIIRQQKESENFYPQSNSQFYFERKSQQTLIIFISSKSQEKPNSTKNISNKEIQFPSQIQNNSNQKIKINKNENENEKYAQLLLTPFVILQNQHNVKIHMVERTIAKKILGKNQAGILIINIQYLTKFERDLFIQLKHGTVHRDTTFFGQISPLLTFQTLGIGEKHNQIIEVQFEEGTELVNKQNKNRQKKDSHMELCIKSFRIISPLNYFKVQAFHKYFPNKDYLGQTIVDWRTFGYQNLLMQKNTTQNFQLKYLPDKTEEKSDEQKDQQTKVNLQKKVAGKIQLSFRIGYQMKFKIQNQTNQLIKIIEIKVTNGQQLQKQSCQQLLDLSFLTVPFKEQNKTIQATIRIQLLQGTILVIKFKPVRRLNQDEKQYIQQQVSLYQFTNQNHNQKQQAFKLITNQMDEQWKQYDKKKYQIKIQKRQVFLKIRNKKQQ